MKILAQYAIFLLIGFLLGINGYNPFKDWQWWALFITMIASVYARDWAVKDD